MQLDLFAPAEVEKVNIATQQVRPPKPDTGDPQFDSDYFLSIRNNERHPVTAFIIDPTRSPRYRGDLRTPPFDDELKPIGHSDWRVLSSEEVESWSRGAWGGGVPQ